MAYRPQPGPGQRPHGPGQRPPGPPVQQQYHGGPPMQQNNYGGPPPGGFRPTQPPSPQHLQQRPPQGGYPPRSPPRMQQNSPGGYPQDQEFYNSYHSDTERLLGNGGKNNGNNYNSGEKQPQVEVNMKRHSVRHVALQDGNLVLDCPVPDKLLRNVKYMTGEEFTLMRYTAATCDPNNFYKERYSLRPVLLGRHTELFIVMTMYNEDDVLFLKTVNAVMKNVAHLCSRSKSKTWGPDGWQKIVCCVVSDGRKKIHPRVLKVLGAMGVYQDGIAKTQVGDKDVTAHIYEYTTQVQVDNNMKMHGPDKGVVPVQMIFCLKEQNKKKLNSHRWFFNAFAQQLNPNVCVLLDVGTKPSGTSIYHLWKAFDRDESVGGACGEICAELGAGWTNLLNPLVASQNFEYKMSNILDKPLESVFGYISVLPGAFSAYRYKALKDYAPNVGPLASYFKGETLHGAGAGIFESNMYLAEDRILCFELVAKRNEAWLLKYVKSAKAETDVPDSLDEFISQRRRWLNGSFFAAIFGTVHFYRIWESGHNIFRKSFLMIEFLYNAINLIFNWFALGNFYLTFFFLTRASVPATYSTVINGQNVVVTQAAASGISDPFFGMGDRLFSPLRELYIGIIIIIFISALGNRPQGSKFIYWMCVALFAIIMLIMLYVSGFTIYQTVPKTLAGWKSAPVLFESSPAFRDIIISLGSTYILYFVASFLYMEPWHMFTSFLQYLFLLPAYVNILMVYAFCNTHDVSWGTKGDNKVESLGGTAPVKGKDGKSLVQVEVPTERADINAAYDEFLRDLAIPEEKKKGHRDAATKQEDYYKLFRTRLVLTWMFSNALLIIIMSSDLFLNWITKNNPNKQKSYNPYLTFIFWSVAGLSAIRFIGSTMYLVLRIIFG